MAVAEKVKNIIVKFDPNAEVYVFGSTVEGKITGASDIDIL
ncbi:MAG: nucleotidyltransferase domain-containing protein, partial [Candidatus Methanomethylicota archaeon]